MLPMKGVHQRVVPRHQSDGRRVKRTCGPRPQPALFAKKNLQLALFDGIDIDLLVPSIPFQ